VRASLTPPIESPATARTGILIARTSDPARPNVLICTVAGLSELDTTAVPNGGSARGYQALFASLAIAVPLRLARQAGVAEKEPSQGEPPGLGEE
jgi:hypothetical protein